MRHLPVSAVLLSSLLERFHVEYCIASIQFSCVSTASARNSRKQAAAFGNSNCRWLDSYLSSINRKVEPLFQANNPYPSRRSPQLL